MPLDQGTQHTQGGVVSKLLSKGRLHSLLPQHGITFQCSMASHLSGLWLLLLGVTSEAVHGCALPVSLPTPQGSLSSVRTSKVVIFSPSAYRN